VQGSKVQTPVPPKKKTRLKKDLVLKTETDPLKEIEAKIELWDLYSNKNRHIDQGSRRSRNKPTKLQPSDVFTSIL
jgi:hypothetical protein